LSIAFADFWIVVYYKIIIFMPVKALMLTFFFLHESFSLFLDLFFSLCFFLILYGHLLSLILYYNFKISFEDKIRKIAIGNPVKILI